MYDPKSLEDNHIFQALLATTRVPRKGLLNVDVTGIFAQALDGLTFPAIIEEMRQLGAIWPLPVPAPGTKSGISLDYDKLEKIPHNKFRPYDEVRVLININDSGTVQVTLAIIVNTAAYP